MKALDRFEGVILGSAALACAGLCTLSASTCGLMLAAVIYLLPVAWWALSGAAMRDGTRVIEHSDIVDWLEVEAIALWPCVALSGAALTAKGNPTRTLRHERIHLAQQSECLVLPFYALYLAEGLIRYMARDPLPYDNMCFEAEAFDNERRPSYLRKRQRFAFLNYFTSRTRSRCPGNGDML